MTKQEMLQLKMTATRRCMALGKHKTVTVRVLRVLRIDLHFLKV